MEYLRPIFNTEFCYLIIHYLTLYINLVCRQNGTTLSLSKMRHFVAIALFRQDIIFILLGP